jgi:hypothetical protein
MPHPIYFLECISVIGHVVFVQNQESPIFMAKSMKIEGEMAKKYQILWRLPCVRRSQSLVRSRDGTTLPTLYGLREDKKQAGVCNGRRTTFPLSNLKGAIVR